MRATHAARAAGMAGEQIDRVGDKSASVKKQARRKRRLIKGPVEFRGVRSDDLGVHGGVLVGDRGVGADPLPAGEVA